MHIKWKNIVYVLVVCLLVFAVVQQVGILVGNIRNVTAFTENDEATKEEIAEEEVSKEEGKADNSNDKKVFNNEFFKIIMKKSIPAMELGYKKNGEEKGGLLSAIFAATTKINMKDPKTLLSSQIPMLEKYEPDDVEITVEEQKAFNELTQKPMNDEKTEVATTMPSRAKLDNKEPLVLIYHSHATESFMESDQTKIEYSSPYRTLDKSKNMVKIGEEIKNILEKQYGIKVIHDTTLHDYPDYNESYSRSLKTVEKQVKENPSIKYVFDLHRDGLNDTPKNREKTVTVFGEQKSAKVFMVVGKDNFNAQQNMQFAQKIQNNLKNKQPELTQPIVARENRKYNQFVSDYAALIEVGSNLNTLEEALQASVPLGHVIGEVIVNQEKK
ncbi:stage II sporulation protein P [Irregularibacter muris]|uniref:Stage II sporulation protein P n=1 Tax=Irregularibacter muris TaxID=1796619 RepID=A0AAE3KYN9_9FIRM|nr:stage II sporulation protein P [Irregularibacter muris]MCR1897840.1 stage II sporulation protein P [Irregularibacter muris]